MVSASRWAKPLLTVEARSTTPNQNHRASGKRFDNDMGGILPRSFVAFTADVKWCYSIGVHSGMVDGFSFLFLAGTVCCIPNRNKAIHVPA